MNNQIYIPAFQGGDGGIIKKAFTLPQLADALDFSTSMVSTATTAKTINVRGKGKLTIEYFNGTAYQYEEVRMREDVDTSVTISYSKGKNVTLCGCVTYLLCDNNQLTALNVSHNPALIDLNCSNNQLTALDVSHNPALTSLNCSNNQLTALDVSHNPALTSLNCYSNQLTTLDVSKNTALTSLSCDDNQLITLDVSNNTELSYLTCDNNQLTIVKFAQFKKPVDIIIYKNPITDGVEVTKSWLNSLPLQEHTCDLYVDINDDWVEEIGEYYIADKGYRVHGSY